ncbi:PREDICTED: uncharacterized protein LOC107164712 [Diuraphis noxia]|uniref:uncharacterized protein LOC107164712 n=1 Tax=Diuraphis noxia TaxID=143948 RepID=UPI000763993F|nr:PREDICTED: uncharacterized protein LOC107164712 [Diuraphis noxia]
MIGHHSYDNIAECIDKVLNEFNIQNKTTLVVTDNTSNFVKAFRVFSNENETEADHTVNDSDETEETDIDPTNIETIELTSVLGSPNIEKPLDFSFPPHQRCAAHTLNLIAVNDISEAEKDVAYRLMSKRVFGKCQKLFNKQNQSTICADQIKKYLGRYLITPNATRWNSYYDAIKCVVNNIEKIEMICIELQLPIISKPREVAFLIEYLSGCLIVWNKSQLV